MVLESLMSVALESYRVVGAISEWISDAFRRRPSSVVPDTVFLKSRVELVFSASVSDSAPLDPIELQAKCNFIRVKLAMTVAATLPCADVDDSFS